MAQDVVYGIGETLLNNGHCRLQEDAQAWRNEAICAKSHSIANDRLSFKSRASRPLSWGLSWCQVAMTTQSWPVSLLFEMCGMVLLLGSSDLNLQSLGGVDKAPPGSICSDSRVQWLGSKDWPHSGRFCLPSCRRLPSLWSVVDPLPWQGAYTTFVLQRTFQLSLPWYLAALTCSHVVSGPGLSRQHLLGGS